MAMGSEGNALSPITLPLYVTSECLFSLSGPQRSHRSRENYSRQLRGTKEVGESQLGHGLEFLRGCWLPSAVSEVTVRP